MIEALRKEMAEVRAMVEDLRKRAQARRIMVGRIMVGIMPA